MMDKKTHSDGMCHSCGGMVDGDGYALGGEVDADDMTPPDSRHDGVGGPDDLRDAAFADALMSRRVPRASPSDPGREQPMAPDFGEGEEEKEEKKRPTFWRK